MRARGVTRRTLLQAGIALVGLELLSGCGTSLPWARPTGGRRIGFVGSGLPSSALWSAFMEGMRDLGYVEGQNLHVEYGHATGDTSMADAAVEVVRLRPEVIVTVSVGSARVARGATSTIPIVNLGGGDLATSELVATQGRPGANVTGLGTPLLIWKQLQVLGEAVPGLARVAGLFDTNADVGRARASFEGGAQVLGLGSLVLGIGQPDDLPSAFEAATRAQASALYVYQGPLIDDLATQIAELAVQNRLPLMWGNTETMERGGLMAYGANRADLARRAASYVDKILKGANPAELPVEQPVKFDLVVNLKTAQALGVKIPPSVLAQATEVIA